MLHTTQNDHMGSNATDDITPTAVSSWKEYHQWEAQHRFRALTCLEEHIWNKTPTPRELNLWEQKRLLRKAKKVRKR